jgi:hypothetical protein
MQINVYFHSLLELPHMTISLSVVVVVAAEQITLDHLVAVGAAVEVK